MVAKFVENDGDPRKVFSNYIAPRIQAATRGEEPIGRIHSMNETKLADFARKRGLDCRVQQGEADFTQLRVRLKQLIVEGWVIGFKLPGEDPEHCEMLHPDSIKFLSSRICLYSQSVPWVLRCCESLEDLLELIHPTKRSHILPLRLMLLVFRLLRKLRARSR